MGDFFEARKEHSWMYYLWWTRRITKFGLDMVPSLVAIFCVLPRAETALTYIGQHTLYIYLFHHCAIVWRFRIIGCHFSEAPAVWSGAGGPRCDHQSFAEPLRAVVLLLLAYPVFSLAVEILFASS